MKGSNTNFIPAGTSPGLTRSRPATWDTVAQNKCVPRIILRDINKNTYVQSKGNFYFKNGNKYQKIKPCKVLLSDCLTSSVSDSMACISKCGIKNCKTCSMLITSPEFSSNLTGKSFTTKCLEPLDCTSRNLIYGIECSLCGLIYVGETGNNIRSRMNGHRSGVNHSLDLELYKHFNQDDHSILSMRVRILEKIYHHTNSSALSSPFRRQRELHWIRQLGTAMPYGCNDNIKDIGNLSSPRCSDVNVMGLFDSPVRRKRSHGHRHYHRPQLITSSSNSSCHDKFIALLPYMQRPLGLHHIRTSLFSLSVSDLRRFRDYTLGLPLTDPNTKEYRLSSIIADIALCRLFKPVCTQPMTDENRHFMHLTFCNKGIDAINISNVLHNKKVISTIPPYFKNQSVPILSYRYTKTISSKIFNYNKALQHFKIEEFLQTPASCDCSTSPFKYAPIGHVVTGDLNLVQHNSLRNTMSRGPKFREPQHINWNHNFKIIMESVEEYARKWAKREDVELDTLSEWVKSVRHLVRGRIGHLKFHINRRPTSVFKDPDAVKCLTKLHNKYVVVPADKAANNIVFVCKRYYYECLIAELGVTNTSTNSTYRQSMFNKTEILANHKSFMTNLNITTKDDLNDLPSLYWIPKLHKKPYKARFIAGSSKCSTTALSKILTSVLCTIKQGLRAYCDVVFSRSGINQMWILKNSKELLDNLKSRSTSKITAIKTFDFSTLYTTIPHDKLKERLKDIIHQAFFYKNGTRRYTYIALGYDSTYFVKYDTNAKVFYTEKDIISMLEFLIDNIFVEFGGHIFQQCTGIPMGTNCAPLLADLFLYSYEAEFIQSLVRQKKLSVAKAFNFTFRYIDDVISLNNSIFSDYLPMIYPPELEIKETTESVSSASYLDIFLEFDSNGDLSTRLYDKRDDFNFTIINFPHLDSNIPLSPAYGVYISQLIRYARACSSYGDFVVRHSNLSCKLINQGYSRRRLVSSFKRFFGRCHKLVDKYNVTLRRMITDGIGDICL